MNRPASRLRAIAEIARACADLWSTYEETEALLARSMIPSSGDGRGSEIPDPTANAASSHEHFYETVDQLARPLEMVRAIERRMVDTVKHHPRSRELDKAVARARCDGSVDPDCVDLAVVNDYRGSGHALCNRCRMRLDRADERKESA